MLVAFDAPLELRRTWPWAAELAVVFTRLRALPLRC